MALPAAGCLAAAPLFVPGAIQGTLSAPQLRNHSADQQATGRSGFTSLAFGAAAASALAVSMQSSASRTRVVRAAEATSTTAEAAEPPPPPPFDPKLEIGVLPPLDYFDPAGFAKVGDKDGFRNLRAAELKHGRVAMMAAAGAVLQHYVHFPGFGDVPNGLSAVTTAPGSYGFAALFLLSGALELLVWTQDPNKEVGNFGDPLGLAQYDIDMRNRELNNGRFAMFSALGIIVAELYTGHDGIVQLGWDFDELS